MKHDKVGNFLEEYKLTPRSVDTGKTIALFIAEMEKGLSGEKSSLPMIPTYICPGGFAPRCESVIAIDAGGTNLRVSCVRFEAEGKPVIENFHNHPMPGTKGGISVDRFFTQLASYVAPVAEGREKIGFCFSFPATITPDKDGRIIMFDKEVEITGAKGRLLGEGLIAALHDIGVKNIKKVVVINDTVATALGAQAQLAGSCYDGYMGFILGTGTNTCYAEDRKNIKKEPAIAKMSGSMLINVESGSFDKAERGLIDIELDSRSYDPGKMQLEKMIAGAYIGEIFRLSVLKAKEKGILSGLFIEKAGQPSLTGTREMSAFLDDPYEGFYSGLCAGESDREALRAIARAIIERAGKLAAAKVLATALKSGQGKNPLRPVFVSAEGTTLYKLKGLHESVSRNMRQYAETAGTVNLELGRVENTTVFGSAISAFM
ncbi:MAG: hexokinase [Bacillota bacterium]|nr:hexokinase [Bacillota bacterium]